MARLKQIRASRGHDFLIGSAKRLLGIDAQSPGQPHPRLESTSDQLDPLLSRTGREGLVRIPVDPRLQTRAEIAKAELDLGELQEGMPQAFGVALGARLEPPRDLGRAGQGRQAPRNARKGVGSSPPRPAATRSAPLIRSQLARCASTVDGLSASAKTCGCRRTSLSTIASTTPPKSKAPCSSAMRA